MTKLKILSGPDKEDFRTPPKMNGDERITYFNFSEEMAEYVDRFNSKINKVCFVILTGYFKLTGRFYSSNTFHKEDIEYVSKELNVDTKILDWEKYLNSGSQTNVKKAVMKYQGIKAFVLDKRVKNNLKRFIKGRLHPKIVFWSLCEYLMTRKMEIPSYGILQQLITKGILKYENSLLNRFNKAITIKDKELLNELLEFNETDNSKISIITILKKPKQSIKQGSVSKTVKSFKYLKQFFEGILSLMNKMNLSEKIVKYYGNVIKKSKLYQIKTRNDRKKYLYLFCFVIHQFHLYQDLLVEILLKSVQKVINYSNKYCIEKAFEKRNEDYEKMDSFIKVSLSNNELIETIRRILIRNDIDDTEKVMLILSLLEEEKENQSNFKNKVREIEKQSSNIKKNNLFYEALESKSVSLQLKLSEMIKHLDFDNKSSNIKLIGAIDHFKLKDSKIDKNAPTSFLDNKEIDLLFDEKNKFRQSLYKSLLFVSIANGLKTGALNLKYSYKYQSLDEYLIDKYTWEKSKDAFLRKAGLKKFKDFDRVISILSKLLDKEYNRTNKNIIKNKNPYANIVRGKLKLITPKVNKENTVAMKELFPKDKYISLLEILSTVNSFSNFLEPIHHYQHKYTKKKPSKETFYSALIGNGCNIGISKMSRISNNINKYELEKISNWYFTPENLDSACNKILNKISNMDIIKVFKRDQKITHTSSDGQKKVVNRESLNANYSYKYFGHRQGVSIYSFIDENHRLFYSTVISSSEREAAYVIDGLMHNEVVKSDIHSTDTHGYSEIIFGVTHLLNISFAPRIKNIKHQSLYSLKERKYYSQKGFPILPKGKINVENLKKHWDDILRLIATIALKKSTASQIFKRLSSYSKHNPLYTAIKSFGRIIKSIFILRYINEVELRQMIEKQLNKVETFHRLANAVSIGNPEWSYSTKEEQEVVEGCKRLIELSIICWNYLYLSQLLINNVYIERLKYIKIIKNGSIIVWHHINFLGEYDFSEEKTRDSIGFNYKDILTLKVA